MKDYIVRATAAGDSIRAFAMISTETVETAHRAHGTSNVVTAALGRLLTAGAMMGSMMKNNTDVLTLKIGCGGPVKGLTVTSCIGETDSGRELVCVRGYANEPRVEIPLKPNGHLDVGGALGPGILSVIKDMGLKEPFSGQTELVTGEIAEDLTYYFASSEQVPSSVALGVLTAPEGEVLCAGGFIVQLMPFASEEVTSLLEQRLSSIEPITTMLAKGMTPEEILGQLFEGCDLNITDTIPAAFKCNCSKDRVKKAVMSIEDRDIEEMIADDKPIEVNCHFCGSQYSFTTEELKRILQEKKNS